MFNLSYHFVNEGDKRISFKDYLDQVVNFYFKNIRIKINTELWCTPGVGNIRILPTKILKLLMESRPPTSIKHILRQTLFYNLQIKNTVLSYCFIFSIFSCNLLFSKLIHTKLNA